MELDLRVDNLVVDFRGVLGFVAEGELPTDEFVEEDTQREDVSLEAVPRLIKHLGSDVVEAPH